MQNKKDVLSRVSHEIRTPLNSIMGLNFMIEENPTDVSLVSDCAKKIASASAHILSLINNILDMEQGGENKMSCNPATFSMKQFLKTLSDIYQNDADQSGVSFTFTLADPFSEFVIADKYILNQILSNLLSNAVRFNKAGGTIDFIAEDLGQTDGKNHTFRFTVSDTGIGISNDQLKRIFTPFSSTTTQDDAAVYGTGMGLSVAQANAAVLGSQIHVRSIEEQGSTFWFEVNLPVPDAVELPATDGRHELEGACILIADDNATNCHIVSHILESFGCKVEITNNGKDALALFASSEPGHYDAILLDIRMPKMDGLEVCRRIRAMGGENSFSPDALSVPIIAMTANVMQADKEKSFAAGMNAHINKPISPDDLYTVLASLRRN